ncbi:DUF4190 domain-containing protein [Humidisolicoccus flavus]|uniref:DUF4190 domain-containing protein n=1 Tax=Humidisolicoccus flavus TaxID=3111414 RepID=UPI0032510F7B
MSAPTPSYGAPSPQFGTSLYPGTDSSYSEYSNSSGYGNSAGSANDSGMQYSSYGLNGEVSAKTNPLAIASIITSFVGMFAWIIGPIGGVVLAHVSMYQIKQRGHSGRSLAITGLVIGYGLLVLQVVALGLLSALVVQMISLFQF